MKIKIGSLVLSLMAAFLISIPVYVLEEEFKQEHSKDVRLTASRELTRIKEVMQSDLQSALSYAHFLELIIQQNTDFTTADFELYAEMITTENNFVTSAVLAPKGIVEYIYPVTPESNQFLGQDLLNDPGKKMSTQYAVENRIAVIQGPFEEAGSLYVYNRQPVFIDDEFYGFVSISVNFYQLLEENNIKESIGDILLALQVNSILNPNSSTVTWGNVAIFGEEPETVVLEFSGEEWVLAAYPIGGWNKRSNQNLPSHFAFYFVLMVSWILLYVLITTYSKHREEAYHDGLTQALNKKRFEKHVKMRLKNQKSKDTLLMIDINNFKMINDKYGHAVGDHVLIVSSERLRRFVRKMDKVGRVGGDEFMVYLYDILSEEHMLAIVRDMYERLSQPIVYQDDVLNISVSIGWSFTSSSTTFEEIYSKADEMMYEEKCRSKEFSVSKNS